MAEAYIPHGGKSGQRHGGMEMLHVLAESLVRSGLREYNKEQRANEYHVGMMGKGYTEEGLRTLLRTLILQHGTSVS